MRLKYAAWSLYFVILITTTENIQNRDGTFVEKLYEISPPFCTHLTISARMHVIMQNAENCRKQKLICIDLLLTHDDCLFWRGKFEHFRIFGEMN